ncbi:MAG: hypothetical protein IJ125_04090 [Atopobiaceae bacterium]|nr:hypothetical protein [Atopobiaceae bacterium]
MELVLKLIVLASGLVKLAAALVEATTLKRKLKLKEFERKRHTKARRRVHTRRKREVYRLMAHCPYEP